MTPADERDDDPTEPCRECGGGGCFCASGGVCEGREAEHAPHEWVAHERGPDRCRWCGETRPSHEACTCPDCDGNAVEESFDGSWCEACATAGCRTGDPVCPAGLRGERLRDAAPALLAVVRAIADEIDRPGGTAQNIRWSRVPDIRTALRAAEGEVADRPPAAAPDLAAACREALAFFAVNDDEDARRVASLIRAALAKAGARS